MKIVTLKIVFLSLLFGAASAHAEEELNPYYRPTIRDDEWRQVQTSKNIKNLERFSEELNKAGKTELAATLLWRILLSGGLCTVNGVTVGAAAAAETLPVINGAGTLVGVASNPDYAWTQQRRLDLEAFLSGAIGGAISTGMDAFFALAIMNYDWYGSRMAYAGTHAADVALFSNASDCRLHAKKAGIAFDLLLNGSVKDPRVMSHGYFQKKEIQNAVPEKQDKRDSASAE
jgi:hypothetical protein